MQIRTVASSLLLVTITAASVCVAEAATPAEKAKASLQNYFQAWNEPDADQRKTLLEAAWAENATYTDPSAHVEGRAALVKHIGGFMSNPQFKGFSIVQASDIDFHHHVFRFEWEMKDPSGTIVTAGMDYGEFNDDGTITKIVGFFGPFREQE